MVSKGTIVAIVAWLMKASLLILGVWALLYPDFALYIRAVGFVGVAVAVLSFRTTQRRLLSERGIRIPNVVVGIVLVVMIASVVLVIPDATDLDVTDERTELTGSELVYEMTMENTGDGTVSGTDVTVHLNTTEGTVAETVALNDRDIGRGNSREITATFPLNDLNAETRSTVERGNYEIFVVFNDGGVKSTHTYVP